MNSIFKHMYNSTEKVIRYILPGGYIVFLWIASHRTTFELTDYKIAAVVILFVGPTTYLFYRQVIGVIDDIILFYQAKKENTSLIDYKSELYQFIQGKKPSVQQYLYYKFASVHNGMLLSALTVTAVVYSSFLYPRACFLTNHRTFSLIIAVVVLIVSVYNFIVLHRIQSSLKKKLSRKHDPKKTEETDSV